MSATTMTIINLYNEILEAKKGATLLITDGTESFGNAVL